MSKIEGIIPHPKHATVVDRRGKFISHTEIKRKASLQSKTVVLLVIVTGLIIAGVWALLASSGAIFSKTGSDSKLVNSLQQSFTDADRVRLQPAKTPQEEELMKKLDKELFPEFNK